MDLPLFVWKCYGCNSYFDSPGYGADYGEFLMRSESGEMRFLDAIASKEFSEVATIIDSSEMVKLLTEFGRSDAIQATFSFACDYDSSGKPFRIAFPPRCVKCGSYKVKLHDTDPEPFAQVTVEAPPPTHFAWNRLGLAEKKRIVASAISEFIRDNPSSVR